MKKTLFLPALLIALLPAAGHAQLTVRAGVHTAVDDLGDSQAAAERVLLQKKGALTLGATLDLGHSVLGLWIAGDYVPGYQVARDGVAADSLTRKVVALSGDLVFRPIPRILVLQPYVLGGVSYLKENFQGGSVLPDDWKKYGVNVGAGADLKLGGLGLAVEMNDHFAKPAKFDKASITALRHNLFATVGLKFGL